jgi:hypothetical protein
MRIIHVQLRPLEYPAYLIHDFGHDIGFQRNWIDFYAQERVAAWTGIRHSMPTPGGPAINTYGFGFGA